jgi:hypothetical protein
VKLKGLGQIGEVMFFSLCDFFLAFVLCHPQQIGERKCRVQSSMASTNRQTHRFVLDVCVFFSHDTWKISAGYHGKKTKACVSKNEMLAQVTITLLKYHIKLVRLGEMDDKWDGWMKNTNSTKRKLRNF